jgi:hypothetical protein
MEGRGRGKVRVRAAVEVRGTRLPLQAESSDG